MAKTTFGSLVGGILVMALLVTFLQNNPAQLKKNMQEEAKSQIGEEVAHKINEGAIPPLVDSICQTNERGCQVATTTQLNLNIVLTALAVMGPIGLGILVYKRVIPLLP